MPTYAAKAVLTSLARLKYAIATSSASALSAITTFKVGLGGWTPSGGVRAPDPALTDLDIVLDQSRAADDKRYPLISAANGYTAMTYGNTVFAVSLSGMTVSVPCKILSSAYNSDGVGNPQIGELGLFDAGGTMVVYATFSRVTKDATKALDFSNVLVF